MDGLCAMAKYEISSVLLVFCLPHLPSTFQQPNSKPVIPNLVGFLHRTKLNVAVIVAVRVTINAAHFRSSGIYLYF